MSDEKTSPRHYAGLCPEPVTVIEGWSLGFHLGNAVKYIARAGRKAGETVVDDLRKARWYLDREICRLAPVEHPELTTPEDWARHLTKLAVEAGADPARASERMRQAAMVVVLELDHARSGDA